MDFEMPSIRSLMGFASNLLAQVPMMATNAPSASISHTPYSNAPTCPVDSPLSCHNTTTAPDSCCFVYPGGQLLSTQFWDTAPSIGPIDSWTLHGLWPDLCDGTYPTYCHSTPQYKNITQILTAAGQTDLLEYMNEYWLPNRGLAEVFWQHEFNKHGTCVNTLSPSCYGDTYQSGDEVVDFMNKAVDVFKKLDTYKALAAAGILPSTSKTYTNAEIQAALSGITGSEVVLGCQRYRGNAYLNQAWYSYNVKGSLQLGDFVPTSPAGKGGRGTCPQTGIKYLPKKA